MAARRTRHPLPAPIILSAVVVKRVARKRRQTTAESKLDSASSGSRSSDSGQTDSRRPRHRRAIVVSLLTLVATFALAGSLLARRRGFGAPTVRHQVVRAYPHDQGAFSQGLAFDGETLYESTGQYGRSTIRRVNLETGRIEQQLYLDKRLFGEGLTLFGDKVIQLTWKQRLGYIYDAKTLKLVKTFRYNGQGWGITYDGEHLIVSDGSDRLKFWDPDSFAVVRTLRVTDGGRAVRKLNELEYVNGEILANVWYSDRIAMISPDTGKVNGWIDLSRLPDKPRDREAVLNGIAYGDGRLFVTGKNWPKLFEIKLNGD